MIQSKWLPVQCRRWLSANNTLKLSYDSFKYMIKKESVIMKWIFIIFYPVCTYFLKLNNSPFIITACKRVALLKTYHRRIKFIMVRHNMRESKLFQTLYYGWTFPLRPKTCRKRISVGRGSLQSAHEGLLTLPAKPPCVQNKWTVRCGIRARCPKNKSICFITHFASWEKMFKTSKQVHV